MGGTRWSEDHYHDRKAELKRLKKSAFEYDERFVVESDELEFIPKWIPGILPMESANRATARPNRTRPQSSFCLMSPAQCEEFPSRYRTACVL